MDRGSQPEQMAHLRRQDFGRHSRLATADGEEGGIYLVRSSTTSCQQVGKGEDAQLPLTRPSRDPELSRPSLEESLADRPQTPDQSVER